MTEPDPIDNAATQFQDADDEYVAWTPRGAVERVLALPCKVYISGGKGRVEFDVDDLAAALGLTTEEATAWVARNL